MLPEDFNQWTVRNSRGEMVPFSSFATASWDYGSPRLERYNGVPAVNMNGEGVTYTTQGGLISQVFISSAGYLGAMAFGALLLALIRKAVAARIVLLACGIYVFALTMIFGLFKPLFSINAWSGIPFTLLAGTIIAAGLILIARFASARVASFFISFLAVQCVLNALFDLRDLFWLSSPFEVARQTDAMNMANATGIPAIFWSVLWIALALGIVWFAMRLYVAGRDKGYQPDLPFEEAPPV